MSNSTDSSAPTTDATLQPQTERTNSNLNHPRPITVCINALAVTEYSTLLLNTHNTVELVLAYAAHYSQQIVILATPQFSLPNIETILADTRRPSYISSGIAVDPSSSADDTSTNVADSTSSQTANHTQSQTANHTQSQTTNHTQSHATNHQHHPAPTISTVIHNTWSFEKFIDALGTIPADNDLLYIRIDAPLLNYDTTDKLLALHGNHYAEYTYAIGYPEGFAPEVLDATVIPSFGALKLPTTPFTITSKLFDLISIDINAYDVESLVSPLDMRQNRLQLHADSRHNWQVTKHFASTYQQPSTDALQFIAAHPRDYRQLPMFISIQLTTHHSQRVSYLPPQLFEQPTAEMSIANLKKILAAITAFSPEALLHFGFNGEVGTYSALPELVALLADCPHQIIIETSGVGWPDNYQTILSPLLLPPTSSQPSPSSVSLQSPASPQSTSPTTPTTPSSSQSSTPTASHTTPTSSSPPTPSTPPNIRWLVTLDSIDEQGYRHKRGDGFTTATAFTKWLFDCTPHTSYVQAIRLKGDEEATIAFYRHWKQTTDNIVIRKYNSYCDALPNRLAVDLRPIKRTPCWHLMRDLYICADGTVPMCHQVLDRSALHGNIFTESIDDIWRRGEATYLQHINADYPALCQSCDEYYLYNN